MPPRLANLSQASEASQTSPPPRGPAQKAVHAAFNNLPYDIVYLVVYTAVVWSISSRIVGTSGERLRGMTPGDDKIPTISPTDN